MAANPVLPFVFIPSVTVSSAPNMNANWAMFLTWFTANLWQKDGSKPITKWPRIGPNRTIDTRVRHPQYISFVSYDVAGLNAGYVDLAGFFGSDPSYHMNAGGSTTNQLTLVAGDVVTVSLHGAVLSTGGVAYKWGTFRVLVTDPGAGTTPVCVVPTDPYVSGTANPRLAAPLVTQTFVAGSSGVWSFRPQVAQLSGTLGFLWNEIYHVGMSVDVNMVA